MHHPWANSHKSLTSLHPTSFSVTGGGDTSYNLLGEQMKTGAEVTGPHSPVPFTVIPTSWNWKSKMKPLYYGQIKTPEFCCTFSVQPGYRCTSRRSFHPCESFPWVITFLFMGPILALLKNCLQLMQLKLHVQQKGKLCLDTAWEN